MITAMTTLELTDDELFVLNSLVNANPSITFRDEGGVPSPVSQRRFDQSLPLLKWKVIDAADQRERELQAAGDNGNVPIAGRTTKSRKGRSK